MCLFCDNLIVSGKALGGKSLGSKKEDKGIWELALKVGFSRHLIKLDANFIKKYILF